MTGPCFFRELRVEDREPACWVAIDRAARHHTMTDVVMRALTAALPAAEALPGVHAIATAGAGDKTFCASRTSPRTCWPRCHE